jgi:undecaprenyl-diphosphatase
MNWLLDLDQNALLKINRDWTSLWADFLFVNITDLHKTFGFKFVFLPLLLLSILIIQRKKGAINLFFLTLGLALNDFLVGNLMKKFFARPRPGPSGLDVILRAPSGSWSFPSAHAANIFFLAVILGCQYPKGRWFFLVFASLVAYSRSYVGVHFPLDCLGGALWGGSLGYLTFQAQRYFSSRVLA